MLHLCHERNCLHGRLTARWIISFIAAGSDTERRVARLEAVLTMFDLTLFELMSYLTLLLSDCLDGRFLTGTNTQLRLERTASAAHKLAAMKNSGALSA